MNIGDKYMSQIIVKNTFKIWKHFKKHEFIIIMDIFQST